MKKDFSISSTVALAGVATLILTGCAAPVHHTDHHPSGHVGVTHPAGRAGVAHPSGHVRVDADMAGITPTDRPLTGAPAAGIEAGPRPVPQPGARQTRVPAEGLEADLAAVPPASPPVDAQVDFQAGAVPPGGRMDAGVTGLPSPGADVGIAARGPAPRAYEDRPAIDAAAGLAPTSREVGYGHGYGDMGRQHRMARAEDPRMEATSRLGFSPLTDTIQLSTWATRFPWPLMSIDTYTFRTSPAARYRADDRGRTGAAPFDPTMRPGTRFEEAAGAAPGRTFRHTPNQR